MKAASQPILMIPNLPQKAKNKFESYQQLSFDQPRNMTKKKQVPKVTPAKTPVDTTEIDDLFSVFSSSAKKAKTSQVDEKTQTPEDVDADVGKASLSDDSLIDDEDLEAVEEQEDLQESSTPATKGTRYDPNRDDFSLPTASNPAKDDDFFDSRGLKRKARALTEDGLPIYTPAELRIGMGGGTDLCPFECNCCF